MKYDVGYGYSVDDQVDHVSLLDPEGREVAVFGEAATIAEIEKERDADRAVGTTTGAGGR